MKQSLIIFLFVAAACNTETSVKLGGPITDTLPPMYMTAGPTYTGYDSVTSDGKRHSIFREILQDGKLSDALVLKGDTMLIIRTLWHRIEQAEERNSDVWRHYGEMMEQVEAMGKIIKELKTPTAR